MKVGAYRRLSLTILERFPEVMEAFLPEHMR